MQNRFNWEILENKKVQDAFVRFANGKSSARELEREFKNTRYSSFFRKLIRSRGVDRARDAARLALSRRTGEG